MRNQSNNSYCHLKNEFFQSSCVAYRSNPLHLWSLIKQVSGRHKQHIVPNVSLESLSSYFGNLVSSSSSSDTVMVPRGPSCVGDLAVFQFVSADFVQSLLAKLDASKSGGPDDINAPLLKALALQLAPSLTELFNCSLSLGKVPAAFKQANVHPLLKPGKDSSDAASYRGLSLTSTLSKVLESIVRDQICNFFSPDELFNVQQYGFHRGHSCEDLPSPCHFG